MALMSGRRCITWTTISAAMIIRIVSAVGATRAAPANGITAAEPADSFDWLKDKKLRAQPKYHKSRSQD